MPEAGSGWGSCVRALADEHDVLLLDLDGVVYVGPEAVAGAPEALARARAAGVRLAFVTNNAARPPDVVARHLTEIGVPAQSTDVVTSAQAAATMLATELPRGSRVLVIGGAGLREAVTERGLVPVTSADDAPVAVVQGFAPETTWAMLLEACVGVNAGLPWVATNTDLTIPTPRGTAPGNGALVAVVRSTTGVTPRVAGKPFRPLMEESCVRTGAQHALVVGDRLDTDIAGAHAAGLPSLLVLTGVSGAADLLRAEPDLRPTYLAADLAGLEQAHSAPRLQDGAWVGDRWRARWRPLDGTAAGEGLVVEPVMPTRSTRSTSDGASSEDAHPDARSPAEARSPAAVPARAVSPSAGPPRVVSPAASTEAAHGDLVASGDAGYVDALRVVCAAVWQRLDQVREDETRRAALIASAEDALRSWTTTPAMVG